MPQSALLEISGSVAWLRLSRPQAANAINDEMRGELSAACDEAMGHAAVRSIIITGQGKNFAAGSDVRELSALTPSESVTLSERIADFHLRIANSEKPVIAAVNGWCLGGGFELALACDIRIAAESARFGLPEPTLGLIAGGGGIPRLARIAGPGVARHMCLTAEIIDARTALDRGIVTDVVADGELERRAADVAGKIAALAPIAVAQVKRVLAAADESGLGGAIAIEAQGCASCVATHDYKEGTQAFLEKRPAQFAGR
jgi:enoyl-CoA hydratase